MEYFVESLHCMTAPRNEESIMKFIYCPRCGKKLIEKTTGDEGLVPFCEDCQKFFFEIPEPCVIICVFNEQGEVALIRQEYVSKEHYVCVAGHIKIGEDSYESAKREVEEEIGIPVKEMFHIKDYAYGSKELLMIGYVAFVEKKPFQLSEEVDSAVWFSMEEAVEKTREGSVANQLVFDAIKFYREKNEKENL